MRGLKKNGQTMVESVVMLPLFLALAIAALQMAQLGITLLITNYAASSVARTAASENNFSVTSVTAPVDLSIYFPKARDLMVAGMNLDNVKGCITRDDPTVPTAELMVAVRSKFQAWPFFADLLHGAWSNTYDVGLLTCPDLSSAKSMGPFNFSAKVPYYFYVTGKAKVRLNYVP